MLTEFYIEAHNSDKETKWQDYVKQKNELYGMFMVEAHEIKKDLFIEPDHETRDYLVGIVTLDLSPQKMYIIGMISKLDCERLIGKKIKSKEEMMQELNKQHMRCDKESSEKDDDVPKE